MLDAFAAGGVEVLVTSPEQLARPDVLGRLAAGSPTLLAIDEVHCVCDWGPDFRPDYLALASAARALGGPRVLGLTATASVPAREEILDLLDRPDACVVVRDVDRPATHLTVHLVHDEDAKWDQAVDQVARLREEAGPAGIVYVTTRGHTGLLAQRLTEAGTPAEGYHGGLGKADRAHPGRVHGGRGGGRRRHQRLRDGHRQARRPLGRARRRADLDRRLPPGDRACGPRRRAGAGGATVRTISVGNSSCVNGSELAGRTVVVTGAGRGLGLEHSSPRSSPTPRARATAAPTWVARRAPPAGRLREDRVEVPWRGRAGASSIIGTSSLAVDRSDSDQVPLITPRVTNPSRREPRAPGRSSESM